MKLTTALGISTCCFATAVWAQTKVAPSQTAGKPAAAVASVTLVKRPELPKFEGAPALKANTVPELKALQISLKKIALNLAAPESSPTPAPSPTPAAPTTTAYQQGSGVLLTVNSLEDTVTRSYLQINNVSVTANSMTGPMRWISVQPCSASSIPVADAVFAGLPSGRHTYMATVVLGPNNGTSPDPVYIAVAGSKVAASAITRNGHTARVLFTYDSAAGNWLKVTTGWTSTGAWSQMLVFQYIQLAALD